MQYNYIIVKNRTQVLVGPTTWRPNFIQFSLENRGIDYTVPDFEPGYVNLIKEFNLEIFPIHSSIIPAIDPIYEELVGPSYTYDNPEIGFVTEKYVARNFSLEGIKNNLKQFTSSIRYKKEISGTMITIDGIDIPLATDRDSRAKYISLVSTIGQSTINYKVQNSFITLNSLSISSIIDKINLYVQEQFDWEKSIFDLIDSANDIDTLKSINIDNNNNILVEV